MSNENTTGSLKTVIEKMHQLSENDQRALAAAVLRDCELEAFVEELDDHLMCERAAEEDGAQRLF